MNTLNKNLLFVFTENCSTKASELLRNKLKNYNVSKIGAYDKQDYLFEYYQENELVAGLYAYFRLGVFCIDILWVAEALRQQNYGTKLLVEAEKVARELNALYIRVNTGTFQALDFYLNHHYEVFAKLPLLTKCDTLQYDYYLLKYL